MLSSQNLSAARYRGSEVVALQTYLDATKVLSAFVLTEIAMSRWQATSSDTILHVGRKRVPWLLLSPGPMFMA